MLRLRFLPGLICGLLVGLPGGILIGLLVLAPHGVEQNAGASLVQDLTRKLEAAKEDRDRTERQFEQFQKLAEQMTASFNSLEMRFKLLEDERRAHDTQAAQPQAAQVTAPARAAVPAPPAPTAPAQAGAPEAARGDTPAAPDPEAPVQADSPAAEAESPVDAEAQ